MSDELIALRKFLDGSAPLDGYWFSEKRPDVPGAFWWRHDLTAIDRAAAELATLRATITRLEGERDAAADVIKQCRDAFAEEMEAWDLDPPLAHLLKAHDRCETWLARAALQEPKT